MRKDIVLKTMGALLLAAALGGCGKTGTEHLDEGYAALSQQDYRGAGEAFSRAVLSGENREEAYRGAGIAYMGRKEYTRAISSFTEALREADIKPGAMETDINYYLATCYYKTGEYDSAIACYDAITDLKPQEKQAYFLRGNMKLYLGDTEGAMADFDSALAVKKNDYSLCLDIYDCMMQHGMGEAGQRYLDTVLTADVKDISDSDKGRLCYYSGEYAQACNYLERARSEGEADAGLIRLLGECYKRQGQYDYAAVVYSGYVDEHGDAQICNLCGLCYVEQGDYEQALSVFLKGQEIKENNSCMQTLRLNELACYEYMGDYQNAAKRLKDYIDDYGSSAVLDKEYAFLTTR